VVRELAGGSLAPVESFGFPSEPAARPGATRDAAAGEAPRWRAEDVRFGEDFTAFRVVHDGHSWGDVSTPLAGAFNVRNVLAAIAAAHVVGADPARVVEAVRSFRSVRRRMEVRGVVDGVTVVDDFAHHPTAVRETILAARQRYPGRRLIAVFEPRSYTAQRREFQPDYQDALGLADEVIIAGLFHPERYTRETALDPDAMVAGWKAAGVPAGHVPDPAEIARRLTVSTQAGDVVLIMSNGGFGGLHDRLLAGLRERAEPGRQGPRAGETGR